MYIIGAKLYYANGEVQYQDINYDINNVPHDLEPLNQHALMVSHMTIT